MAQAALDTAALADFGGELLRDGDPGYDEARRVFNAAHRPPAGSDRPLHAASPT